MLVLAACVLAVLSPLVTLRWPVGLLLQRWRLPLLIWVALALQVLIVEVHVPHGLAPALHVATYVAALTFLWLNRRVAGVVLVAAGALTNGLTIALNGGVLPASARATRLAGVDPHLAFANTAVLDHPVLPWLGDVFAWPAPLPLANTFSVGDLLVVTGVLVAAWTRTRPLSRRTSAPGPDGVATGDDR